MFAAASQGISVPVSRHGARRAMSERRFTDRAVGPHECFITIVSSPYPSQRDKEAAKVLMRHLNRSRRVRDSQKAEIKRLEEKNKRLKMEVDLMRNMMEGGDG